MQRKKILFLFSGILLVFLLIATFFLFKNEDTSQKTNEIVKEGNSSKTNSNTTSSSEIVDSPVSNEDEEEPSTLLYGEGDDTKDYSDNTIKDLKEDTHPHSLKTIFDETENTKTKIEYKLTKPEILKGSTISSENGIMLLARDGYVAVLANGQLFYYDPTNKSVIVIAENVTQAKASEDSKSVIYEEKTYEGYKSYQLVFPMPENGSEEILSTNSSVKDIGKIDKLIYFSTQEDENNSYYYTPYVSGRGESKTDFFAITSTNGTTVHKGDILTYSEEDRSIYKSGDRGSNKTKLFTLPIIEEKYIKQFKVNPYRADRVILSGYSPDIDFPYGQKVFINDTLIDDITDINEVSWLNQNVIVYTDLSMEKTLTYYDFKTRKKTILDSDVSSMTYDKKDQTIYYNKSDNKIRKIVLSVD